MRTAVEHNAFLNTSIVPINPRASGTCLPFQETRIEAVALKRAASMRENFVGTERSAKLPKQEQTSWFQSNPKRVRFGATNTVMVPAVHREDAPMLWHDTSSFEKRRSSDRSLISKHSVQQSPAYHEAVLALMKSYKPEHKSREKLLEQVRTLSQTEVRGLEQRIVPTLKAYRSISVQEVLNLQKKLQAEGFNRSDMAALMLRKKSAKMSRAGRQLAFRLAQVDRMAIAD